MFRHAVVTEVAPAPFRGERSSGKVRREALQPEKLEERLPRPALAVDEQIFERDRVHARVALRQAELPREAVPHPSEGRLARVPFLTSGGFQAYANQQKCQDSSYRRQFIKFRLGAGLTP